MLVALELLNASKIYSVPKVCKATSFAQNNSIKICIKMKANFLYLKQHEIILVFLYSKLYLLISGTCKKQHLSFIAFVSDSVKALWR